MHLLYAKLLGMAKAVFLDRDETLNPDPGYINDPKMFTIFPWVAEELARLKKAGFLLIIVSNQSGIGRGLVTWPQLFEIHQKLNTLLDQSVGIRIDHFAICPHHPDDQCSCRKPKPELLLSSSKLFSVDLPESFLICDRSTDYEAGINAGVRKSFLVRPGDETSFREAISEILKLSNVS